MNLYEMSTKYQQAFFALADGEFDEITISDTLEGLEGELVDKARNVLAYALNRKAEAKALKEGPLAAIQARIKRAESEYEWMEVYLKRNMAAAGITAIEALDGTFKAKLYIGRDESVVIDDESAVPMDYKREIPVSYQVDKALIKKASKDGFEVAGTHIEKRDRLEIK